MRAHAPLVLPPRVAQDVDESELTVEEAKERKIMKVCLCVLCASCESEGGWEGERDGGRKAGERESVSYASRQQLLSALLLPAAGRQPRMAVRLRGGHAAPHRCCCCLSWLPNLARLLWPSSCSCCSRSRTARRRSASRPCASLPV